MVSYLRKEDDYDAVEQSLNPCCNGRWSRTFNMITYIVYLWKVLILVVMEDGLVLDLIRPY